MDVSLFDEAMIAINDPTVLYLGASSQALVGIVVQSSPKVGGGVWCNQIIKRNKIKDRGYFERALISKTTKRFKFS
jgi:hypothetical protein